MRNLINLVSLLEAYNTATTLSTYKEKLERAVEREPRQITPEQALQAFEDADPTPKKAFVLNLIKWYLDGSMRFVEDASKATEPLILYSRFRLRPDMPKLTELSFGDLLDLGDKLSDTKSKKEENKAEEIAFYKREEAKLWLDNENWKVVIPKTEEAAKYFGKNTRWCTSAENNNMFDRYEHYGPLYIILEKKTNKRWQLHAESGQFMNEKDEVVRSSEGRRVLKSTGLGGILGGVHKHHSFVIYNDDDDDDSILWALKQYPHLIEHIDNATEEMEEMVVKRTPTLIRYIENPSEKIQMLAVDQFSLSIQDIKNPTERVQLHCIYKSTSPTMIKRINNPTEDVLLYFLEKYPNSFDLIKNPTGKVKKRYIELLRQF